ncbi:hypothetical protein KSP39_PZI016889 [Platanthera zijinensis]|uniref:Wound-responsive family protein n=1 Tax=Platanthera zijinensis TaxID=2320716 RepID=A0AAP0B6K2_9ASPA
MASARKASLVVATSLAAVEALKDQLGLCRWNYAIRSLNRHALAIARPFGKPRQLPVATAVAAEHTGSKVFAGEARTAERRAEKKERIVQLVCWGPN